MSISKNFSKILIITLTILTNQNCLAMQDPKILFAYAYAYITTASSQLAPTNSTSTKYRSFRPKHTLTTSLREPKSSNGKNATGRSLRARLSQNR